MNRYLNQPLFIICIMITFFYVLSGCKNDPLTPEKTIADDEKESVVASMDILSVNPDITTANVSVSQDDTSEIITTLDNASVEFTVQSTNRDIDLYYYEINYFDPYGNSISQSQYSFSGSVTKKIQIDNSSTDSSSSSSEPVKEETVNISVFSHKIINYATNSGSLDSTTHISPITASVKIWATDDNGVPLADTAHCTLVTEVTLQ